MGVPAFFRWLSRKYPSVIIECVETKQIDPDTNENIYDDGNLPNPNGIEFDNLYLDMNGIIHPCTHPEDKPAPKNEDDMMVAIFECIDRLMNIVRPRKLLYMAIDGVAPRAKMNQQRSRRFRAAKESVEKRLEIERVRSELEAKGCILPPEKEKGDHFDSNCITPGTPFMERLSLCLNYYIHDRLNNNPGWKGLKVILSDANVPGEGEHKIMDFIRKQRSQPDHDPNTQHVLCGADADLIMLGLATHEPNFTIIREEFLPNKPRPCDICNQFGHEMDKCSGLNAGGVDVSEFKPDVPIGAEVKFIFVRLSVLREYLKKTLEMPNLPFKYDFERALDDWVFMCFFVGNDFLPHLPSLEIREGAVDRLVELYKKCVYRTGGYLTDSGDVNLERVQLILNDLGNVEDHIFKNRQKREEQYKAREKSKRKRDEQYNAAILEQVDAFKLMPLGGGRKDSLPLINNYKSEAANLRNAQQSKNASSSGQQLQQETGVNKRTSDRANLGNNDNEEEEEIYDEVRLWEDGFKDRYYESKFDVDKENLEFRYSVALQYVRGLCWVLKYYYQGCASWNWYFPYHYAPFASDFINISGLSTQFDTNSKPFNPLEQLMGVFPAASSSHVPKPWAQLMSDPTSEIIDFYPEDFQIDLNGKKFAWQGVALLPFVDEERLFKALKPYYGCLSEAEIKRNKQGDCRLYVAPGNTKYKFLQLHYKENVFEKTSEVPVVLEGMRGIILKAEENIPQNGTLPSPIMNLHDITDNEVVTVRYRDPIYSSGFVFPAVRLPNAVDPPNVLAPDSREANYRPRIGFNHNLPQAFVTTGGHRLLNNSLGMDNRQGPPMAANFSSLSFDDRQQQQQQQYPFNNYQQQQYQYPSQQASYKYSNHQRNNNWISGSNINSNNGSSNSNNRQMQQTQPGGGYYGYRQQQQQQPYQNNYNTSNNSGSDRYQGGGDGGGRGEGPGAPGTGQRSHYNNYSSNYNRNNNQYNNNRRF